MREIRHVRVRKHMVSDPLSLAFSHGPLLIRQYLGLETAWLHTYSVQPLTLVSTCPQNLHTSCTSTIRYGTVRRSLTCFAHAFPGQADLSTDLTHPELMWSWLPSVPYPPSRDGYWSPVTSTLNWCEEVRPAAMMGKCPGKLTEYASSRTIMRPYIQPRL